MLKTAIAAALLATAATANAATVYLCRAYNGATFWAQQHCNQHNALIERIETVGDVPWDQQVQQAEQTRNRPGQSATPTATNIDQRCGLLLTEKRQIESRYTNWQWQPPEVINPDQQRQRAIDSELRRMNCRMQ